MDPLLWWVTRLLLVPVAIVTIFFVIAIFFKAFDVVVVFGLPMTVVLCGIAGGAPLYALYLLFLGYTCTPLTVVIVAAIVTIFIKLSCDPSGKIANAADLSGRTAIVTGGTGGMGAHIAAGLAEKGAAVTVVSVDNEKVVEAALAKIRAAALRGNRGGSVNFERVDLSSMAAVRDFAVQYARKNDKLNVLVCNAGVLSLPFKTTVDKFDSIIAINYMSHYVLTEHLTPLLRAGAKAGYGRVVNVASDSYKLSDAVAPGFPTIAHGVDMGGRSYLRSKLAVLLGTLARQRLLDNQKGNEVYVFAVHPGSMGTALYDRSVPRFLWPLFSYILNIVLRSMASGALVALNAALSPDAPAHKGRYFANLGPVDTLPKAKDEAAADILYRETRELLAPFLPSS